MHNGSVVEYAGRFSGVIAFCIHIPAYDVKPSGRCFEVTNEIIEDELAIYSGIPDSLLLSVVPSVDAMFAASFPGFVRVCSGRH